MTKEEARQKIEELKKEALEKLEEATEIADEYGISFDWDGPSYPGFGGRYKPAVPWVSSSSCEWEESGESEPGEWVSSSSNC